MRTDLPCLTLIQERFWNAIKDELDEKDKKYFPEFEMTMFLQTWGDTSLGFGGIGGQMMTSAYTTVVRDIYSGWCGVFFGEKLAYKIKDPNQTFNEDICKFQMKPVYAKGAYVRKDRNT